MDEAPARIGGDPVIVWTAIDERHESTGATRHLTLEGPMEPAAGLAIVRAEGGGGYYLLGCDATWQSVTDTWHPTLEAAKAQAEYEYRGVSRTWRDPS